MMMMANRVFISKAKTTQIGAPVVVVLQSSCYVRKSVLLAKFLQTNDEILWNLFRRHALLFWRDRTKSEEHEFSVLYFFHVRLSCLEHQLLVLVEWILCSSNLFSSCIHSSCFCSKKLTAWVSGFSQKENSISIWMHLKICKNCNDFLVQKKKKEKREQQNQMIIQNERVVVVHVKFKLFRKTSWRE